MLSCDKMLSRTFQNVLNWNQSAAEAKCPDSLVLGIIIIQRHPSALQRNPSQGPTIWAVKLL